MKIATKVIYALLITFFSVGNIAFASFPVKSIEKKQVVVEQKHDGSESFTQKQAATKIETLKKNKAVSTSNSGDDDLIITLLLWFFLGFLAAHRWYKKKPAGWNILFILTAGGCGVWAIVDLIHIITGDF